MFIAFCFENSFQNCIDGWRKARLLECIGADTVRDAIATHHALKRTMLDHLDGIFEERAAA